MDCHSNSLACHVVDDCCLRNLQISVLIRNLEWVLRPLQTKVEIHFLFLSDFQLCDNQTTKGALDSKWDLLWHTFWGNPATQCFGKGSAPIPDPRTLETPTEETNYEYLKLPNDDDFSHVICTEFLSPKPTGLFMHCCAN